MSNKYKILHIEDVATDAALAARELKKGNIDFEQYVVDTEKEYRKALDEYAPDIILCDHSLTTFNSSEALKIFKGKKIDIPFILITATLSDEFAISVLKEGADDYILKDRLKRLPSAVVNAIEKYQLNRERKQLVKKAKEKESLSQKRLKNLTNKLLLATRTTGIGIWEYLYNKKKLIADEVTLKQFGLECEDFKNCFSQLLQHVHPDDKIRVNREFQKSFIDHSNIDIEYKVVWKDASIHSVKAVAVVQQDRKGNPQRIIGTHQDITERKKTEEVIRKSEAFNKGVLDSLSSHIAVINSSGTIIKVNKLWKIFGNNNSSPTAKQWGVGSNYFDACIVEGDNDTSSMAVVGIKKVLEGTLENFYLEYPCHSPTEQRWFYMRVKKFDSDDASALIEHQDITERKIAEEKVLRTSGELQQISNDLTNILDSSLDIICTIDGQGKFVKVSAAAEKIWGYTSWELLGTSAMDIVFEDDVENTRKVASEIMDGTPVTMFENRYKRKNGSIVPMLWSSRWDDKDKLSYCVAKDATEKKALEIEKERFQHLFFQAPSCMGILKGPNHIYESANPLLLQLLGRNADIIGKTVEEAVPEMVEQGFLDNLNVVYKTGVAFAANERLVKIDRHQTGNLEDNYLNLILQAYKSNDGCVAGIFIFAINVTEQVLSRKKVEESEKRYRQIVETAQEGIWMIDENNKTTFANEKMCEILECTQAEMVDTSNLSFRDEEEQKNAVEQIERRRKGIKETHEAKYRTKRGKQIWVNISTNPLFNSKGEYKGALAMFTDITNRKTIEKQLAHSESSLKEAQTLAFIGNWQVDLVSKTIEWSDELYKVFALDKEKNIPSEELFLSCIHPDDKEYVQQQISEGKKTLKGCSFDYRLLSGDGIVKYCHSQSKVDFDKNNQPVRLYGVVQDITLRKLSEIERIKIVHDLIERNKELEQFTYIVSHNLRAPVANIISFTDALGDEAYPESLQKEFLAHLSASVSKLDDVIRDLNDVLVIKQKVNDVKELSSFSTVVENIQVSIKNSIEQHKINFYTDFSEADNVFCIKTFLHSILYNLITNSIKYRSHHRPTVISIQSKRKQEGLELIFSDNGLGIDLKKNEDKIFCLYKRFHSGIEGKGIGLFMTKTQIETLGGTIRVSSEINVGTTFTIYLPFHAANS